MQSLIVIITASAFLGYCFHRHLLLLGRNVRWPRRMLPPGESPLVCRRDKRIWTGCYITRSARGSQRNETLVCPAVLYRIQVDNVFSARRILVRTGSSGVEDESF